MRNADGRVLTEALRQGGRGKASAQSLVYQKLGRDIYLDDSCFATEVTIQLENPCAR